MVYYVKIHDQNKKDRLTECVAYTHAHFYDEKDIQHEPLHITYMWSSPLPWSRYEVVPTTQKPWLYPFLVNSYALH